MLNYLSQTRVGKFIVGGLAGIAMMTSLGGCEMIKREFKAGDLNCVRQGESPSEFFPDAYLIKTSIPKKTEFKKSDGSDYWYDVSQDDVFIRQNYSRDSSLWGESVNVKLPLGASPDWNAIEKRIAEVKQCRDAYNAMHPTPTTSPVSITTSTTPTPIPM